HVAGADGRQGGQGVLDRVDDRDRRGGAAGQGVGGADRQQGAGQGAGEGDGVRAAGAAGNRDVGADRRDGLQGRLHGAGAGRRGVEGDGGGGLAVDRQREGATRRGAGDDDLLGGGLGAVEAQEIRPRAAAEARRDRLHGAGAAQAGVVARQRHAAIAA